MLDSRSKKELSAQAKITRLSTYVSHPDIMRSLVNNLRHLKDFGWEKEMTLEEISELWESV